MQHSYATSSKAAVSFKSPVMLRRHFILSKSVLSLLTACSSPPLSPTSDDVGEALEPVLSSYIFSACFFIPEFSGGRQKRGTQN